MARVAVVGAGIAGIACARALHDRGIEVVVLDRGHRIGGRMASRTMRGTGLPYDGRVVDTGAAYLTADEPEFQAVVDGWVGSGLARPWTDTLAVADPSGINGTTQGPMRYAASAGLRSLVEDLAVDLPTVVNPRDVESVDRDGATVLVDGEDYDAAVLAMPDAQAIDVLADDDPLVALLGDVEWLPVLSVVAAYADRAWPDFDAAFVNGSAILAFVADDGRRRGDGAPVLVAHVASDLASRHLDDPDEAAPAALLALRSAIGVTADPVWHEVRRWSLARPARGREAAYALVGAIGVCGDAWAAPPRIQTAFLSGHRLGHALADALLG